MRYSKGEWKAAYKDTFSVESTLNKIILAYLKELYKHKDRSGFGVPMFYVEQQAKKQEIEELFSDEINLDEASTQRIKDLEELIWTFEDNEPKIEEYDFSYDISVDGIKLIGSEEARNQYRRDTEEYMERKMKGYELFGRVYHTLDW